MKIVAELPGMDQKDIDISLTDGVLTIKGEKQSETNGALYSERYPPADCHLAGANGPLI